MRTYTDRTKTAAGHSEIMNIIHVLNGVFVKRAGYIFEQSGRSLLDATYVANDAVSPYLRMNKARGDEDAPAIVQDGDVAFHLIGRGYDGSDFRSVAQIQFKVNGTPGASDMPGEISLRVTKDGASSVTEVVTIDENGIHLLDTARIWKCIELSPTVVKLPGSNPPAEDTIDGYPFHRYDRGTEESIYYIWHVPHDFATGTASVRCDFKFVVENPPASPSGDEAVVMGFAYTRIAEGSVFAASETLGTVTETIAEDETAKIIHITPFGTPDTTGWAPGDTILFRFYRDADNANDTYDNEAVAADNDVWVFDYHLEYLADKLGEASS